MQGVILYGPPASGKDTITEALTRLEPRCHLFQRLKVGEGKTSTYRMIDRSHLDELRARGEVVWENERYGSVYAIDLPGLRDSLRQSVPVLHLGQPAAIDAVRAATPDAQWLAVSLWCPRDVTAARLVARSPNDVAERLRVWDETEPLEFCDLAVNTDEMEPHDVAALVLEHLNMNRKDPE